MKNNKKSFEIQSGPKQEVRDLLCKVAKAELNVRNIFTLPGRHALCVKTFRQPSNFPNANIVGVEREREDCEYIRNTTYFNCLHTTIKEYSKKQTIEGNHFDLVFFDYYSFLSSSIFEDIDNFIGNSNIIHKNRPFVFGITLLKSIRKDKEKVLEYLKEIAFDGRHAVIQNNLEDITVGLADHLIKKFGLHISRTENKEYKAAEGSTTMYFILFVLNRR